MPGVSLCPLGLGEVSGDPGCAGLGEHDPRPPVVVTGDCRGCQGPVTGAFCTVTAHTSVCVPHLTLTL